MIHRTLPDLLYATAGKYPHQGVGFIHADRSISLLLYPGLIEQSLKLLHGMQESGIGAGDRIMLSLETSEETIVALWASFLGGIVPALLQPSLAFSSYNPAVEKAEKVFSILDNPRMIISDGQSPVWQKSNIPDENLVNFSHLGNLPGLPVLPQVDAGDVALVQFSSGSTGDPKGVMLTHNNIITNMLDIIEGIKLTAQDVSVSWMPLYHDMGLIGFHITPTLVGCRQFFIDPVDFIKNPSLWLDNLSDQRCNITGCPNFGQALVNRYLGRKKSESWDFSSIRVIFNGAEPISADTMREFLTRLSDFDLNPASMFPAYGLAEATLAVTFAPLEQEARVIRFKRMPLIQEGVAFEADPDDDNVIELVDLGTTLNNCTVRIVGEDGREAGESQVGSVHVQGENVSDGYYKNPQATRDTFSGGWLRTGDLGFIHKGNLFIMGRLKDVIFINGMNFYAHDLERVAMSAGGMVPGKLVIAGYFDEQEGRDKLLLFLVAPHNEETRIVCKNLRTHLKNALGLHPDTFIPIRSNDIPRTSSGKIQRYKLINRFLQGEFQVVRL